MHTTVDFKDAIESFRDDELGAVLASRASEIVTLRVTGELIAVELAEHADELCVEIESLRIVFHCEPAPWDGRGDEDAYYETEEDLLFAMLDDLHRSLVTRVGQRVKLELRGDGLIVSKPMEARVPVRAFTSVAKARIQ